MVIIVGAGLAGSILAKLLRANRIKFEIYDCEKPWRASVISENLFSLTWKDTLGDKVFNNGLKTLESIVPISSINFKTKAGHNSVLHVHPDLVLEKKYIKKDVSHHGFGKSLIVDCRGYWANVENMVGLTGQGLMMEGTLKQEPIMDMVAPYTHQKMFQWAKNRIWYGDSTCIEHSKYMADEQMYVNRCIARAGRAIGFANLLQFEVRNGIRPWVNKQKGYLRIKNNLIVNTGGWKCGLMIYADQAQKIVKHIKGL